MKKIPMLQPEEFAILPWSWMSGNTDSFREVRECGFNLAGFVPPENLYKASAAGLKCFVFHDSVHVSDAASKLGSREIERRVSALVARTARHKAVFGYYLRDEPGATAFAGLRKWVDAYRDAAPKALPYINLYPNYASAEQMNVPAYAEYIESYVRIVRPPFISYDHYALMDDGSLRDGYFQNLEAVRAAALRHGIPFWNIVLSNAHFSHAEPTEAGLRFQLYTTLAHGARGISYFTYLSPTIGNYRMAPIDQWGRKTPTWEMLRRVNLQLHCIGKTYLTLRSVNVFHHPAVPAGCSGIESSRMLSTLNGYGGPAHAGLLAGEFEGPGGRPFAMVVNKDLARSTWLSVEFRKKGRIDMVGAYDGRIVPWAGENNWLAPGQGMLLCAR